MIFMKVTDPSHESSAGLIMDSRAGPTTIDLETLATLKVRGATSRRT